MSIGILVAGIAGFFVFGTNDDSTASLEKEAQFLISKNEHQKALDVFDMILEIDPDNNYAVQGKTSISQNISEDSHFVLPQQLYSKPLLETHDDIVLDFSDQELSEIHSSLTEDIIEANKLYEKQMYVEALHLYDDVLSDDPLNLYALNGRGGALLSLKQYDDSIVAFDNTLQFYPENTNALNGKAYAFYLKANFMRLPGLLYDSVHTYQKTLEIDSNNINALVGLASALASLERHSDAIFYYKEALSIDSENTNAKNGLFDLWINLGNDEAKYFYFDSAIEYFDKVLEIDPKNLNALLAKAASYTEWGKSQQKHYSSSEEIYSLVLKHYPDNLQALVGMGYVMSEQLKFDQALEYYDQALEIDPDNINAKAGKSFVSKRLP